jgi:hypothetical protein
LNYETDDTSLTETLGALRCTVFLATAAADLKITLDDDGSQEEQQE